MKYIYFFIGNGRDGTNSLASISDEIKELNQAKFKVSHEYFVKEIYNNFIMLTIIKKIKFTKKNIK